MGDILIEKLLSAYLRILALTLRTKYIGEDKLPEKPYIFAFWHSRIPLMTLGFRGEPIKVLISTSRDGEIAVRVLSRFGYRFIRGTASDPKKGAPSLREILRSLRKDKSLIAITPDGPKGPKEEVKPGIAFAAALSGKAVVPIGGSVRRKIILNTWDNFILPLPFSEMVIAIGDPVFVPRKEEAEKSVQRIREGILKADKRAEEFLLNL